EQPSMNAAVDELDTVAIDALDEALLLEVLEIVSRSLPKAAHRQPAQCPRVRRLAKRGAEILDDMKMLAVDRINLVVGGFPVPVVQHHVGDNQALERLGVDEVVRVPVPLADDLAIGQLRPETARGLRSSLPAPECPAIDEVAGRLVVPK